MSFAEELDLEVDKESRFMAEKYQIDFIVAKSLILHGYGMGFREAKETIFPTPQPK